MIKFLELDYAFGENIQIVKITRLERFVRPSGYRLAYRQFFQGRGVLKKD